jgi:hypothetical protein
MFYADKAALRSLNADAVRRDYNRQLDPAAIEALPDDAVFVISPIMIHEHAQGKLIEPHLRCSVRGLEKTATPMMAVLDISSEMFKTLPKTHAAETAKTV